MTAAAKHVRVVGAGPAGLMAADVLSAGGASVEIIDHHRQPARKFLLAGRGGLNLTHSEDVDVLLSRYGTARAALEPAIRAFPPEALRRWCEELGIKTFVGSSGRVFPVGLKASPLLRAWLRRLEQRGVTRRAPEQWHGFDEVPTILAMGGASWPELGSDAEWVETFRAAGIAVSPLVASNGRQRMTWSEHFASRFTGAPLKNVALSAGDVRVRGECMIASDGIEGGAVYALSPQLREAGTVLHIDLKPDVTEAHVAERLARPKGKDSRSTFLRKALNLSPLAVALMREAGSDNPKQVTLTVQGPAGIARAISTAGGVSFDEVTDHFRLKKKPSTWVAGEMLDWDAPTGGYLLQACFATARFAAEDCLRQLS